MNGDEEHAQTRISTPADPTRADEKGRHPWGLRSIRVLAPAVYRESVSILGLSLGRATAIIAVLLTIRSAIQLSAVSYGNSTTAIAILHEEEGISLPVQILASSMSAIAASLASVAILVLTLSRVWWFPRLTLAAMVLIALCPLMIIRDYVWPLLSWLGVLMIRYCFKKWAQAQASRPAPAQRELSADELTDFVVANMREFKTWIRVIAICLLLFIPLSALETRPWMPAQRVVLQNGQPFTGFILSNHDLGYAILRDDTRLIVNYRPAEITHIELCAWRTEIGPGFLPRVIRRDVLLTPMAFVTSFRATGRIHNYPMCPGY